MEFRCRHDHELAACACTFVHIVNHTAFIICSACMLYFTTRAYAQFYKLQEQQPARWSRSIRPTERMYHRRRRHSTVTSSSNWKVRLKMCRQAYRHYTYALHRMLQVCTCTAQAAIIQHYKSIMSLFSHAKIAQRQLNDRQKNNNSRDTFVHVLWPADRYE